MQFDECQTSFISTHIARYITLRSIVINLPGSQNISLFSSHITTTSAAGTLEIASLVLHLLYYNVGRVCLMLKERYKIFGHKRFYLPEYNIYLRPDVHI